MVSARCSSDECRKQRSAHIENTQYTPTTTVDAHCVKSLCIWCFRARAKLGREHSREGSGHGKHTHTGLQHSNCRSRTKCTQPRAKWADILAVVTAEVPQQCDARNRKANTFTCRWRSFNSHPPFFIESGQWVIWCRHGKIVLDPSVSKSLG